MTDLLNAIGSEDHYLRLIDLRDLKTMVFKSLDGMAPQVPK